MTNSVRIDIIHGFGEFNPSLNNLKQGLEGMTGDYTIQFHSPRETVDINTTKDKIKVLSETFINGLRVFDEIRDKSDLIIIHKFISPIDNTVLERLFLTHPNSIYTVYDAEYISNPKKTEFLFKNVDLTHVISHAIAAHAREYTNNIALIPPSVDTEFFSPLSSAVIEETQHIRNSNKFIIGWIGNAADHKENLLHIRDVLTEIDTDTDFTFRLLCGGEMEEELEQQLSASGFDTDIIDWVPWEDVPTVINTFDVGVAPLQDTAFNRGRSSEKIREYMACGCPVVASNVGENPYLLPESAGFLTNNRSEWNEALSTLMEDPTQRKEMGRNAREYVEENYSIQVIADQLEAEINSVLTG